MWNWLLHEIGVRPTSGSGAYAFWSGFGSDLGEVAIIGGLVQVYRRHRCASCHRMSLKGGKGDVTGTHYSTCHKHTNAEHHDLLRADHAVRHPTLHTHLTPKRGAK